MGSPRGVPHPPGSLPQQSACRICKDSRAGVSVIQRLVGETISSSFTQSFMRGASVTLRRSVFHRRALRCLLRTLFRKHAFDYLADVAALEWEHQRVILAADSGAPDVSRLAQLPPELLESIQFALNDACGLVSSAYPILRIWRTNQTETATDEVVDLDEGADRILVRRVRDGTELYRLDPATFTLLQSFSQGRSLGDAFERARTRTTASTWRSACGGISD